MTRARCLGLLTALVLVLSLGGGAAAQPAPSAPAVLVARAELRPVAEGAEFIGRIEALERVEIRARITGFLRDRTFNEGQNVKAGDLLFLIEREPFEAEVASRQAQVEGAQASLYNANLQVTRGQELVRTNAIPRSTLDQRIADQQVAAAQVSQAQAALRQANIQLAYTQIVTPISGRVGRAALTPGNVVSPESGVLTTVVRDDTMRVFFPVAQRQLLALRRAEAERGQQARVVRVRLPDGTLYDKPGQISFINVTTDSSTDSTIVQAVFPNPARLLTDGQVIGVRVETETPREALVIPQSAVQLDQAGAFVLSVGEGNRVEAKRVRLGPLTAGMARVEEGLQPGVMVITEGAQRARPGAVVMPRPAPELPTTGRVAPRVGG
ncbi:MAG TPA: efflux RND transporter periplasmic adaptor subunit [Crenalkalicoccus sp.]|jgi:membrane fusion protein (multidrug efflux system)|nr:efflux RND transporter periplasmic adaptor subunit [Crenalkalicoccus sp.]